MVKFNVNGFDPFIIYMLYFGADNSLSGDVDKGS